MKNQHVVTMAIWLSRKNGNTALPLRNSLYELFMAAYLYHYHPEKETKDFEPVGIYLGEDDDSDLAALSIDLDSFQHSTRKSIPIYVICYIKKVLYPQCRVPSRPVKVLENRRRKS